MTEQLDRVRERLDMLARSDNLIASLMLIGSDLKLMELLHQIGCAKMTVDDLVAEEQAMRAEALMEGVVLKVGAEHEAAYNAVNEAFPKVDAAYKAVLEATALMYLLIRDCDCTSCRQKRQMINADAS